MIDSSWIRIGTIDSLPLYLSLPATVDSISAELRLSNPTVYYPLSVSSSGHIIDSALLRVNDSTFRLQLSIRSILSDTLYLHGRALSGNDTLCTLKLGTFQGDSTQVYQDSTLLIEQADGTPAGVYARFAFVSDAWPNPCYDDGVVTWNLRFDVPTVATFRVYDALGRTVHELTRSQPIGPSLFQLTSDGQYYPGSYTLVVSGSSSSAQRRFVIMR